MAALAGIALVPVCIVFGAVYFGGGFLGSEKFDGPTATVSKEILKVNIVARGSLEAARNADIICQVRSSAKGSTIATTIKWLIDAGLEVKKGDKLMELDSSGFEYSLQDQLIKVGQAEAASVTADGNYKIQVSQNISDVENAKSARDLAKIDLDKYKTGDFKQALQDVEGRIQIALSDLEIYNDSLASAERMHRQGHYSLVKLEGERARLAAAKINLEKLLGEKALLTGPTYQRTVLALTNALEDADRNVTRVQSQADVKLIQAQSEKDSRLAVYKQELLRQKDIETMIERCTILAPQDGMVVYFVPEQAKSGGGTQQAIVNQGEPVREGQKLLQIPDLSKMQVNVRVPEAMVSHLHKEDPNDEGSAQLATIKIDAFPTKLFHGHVKSVDTVSSQQDWFASDVKVYKTFVTLHEQLEGLRPGMSAEVTITANETKEKVLVIPIQAVVGTISMGANRQCFVVRPDGTTRERDIVVGLSNERQVEVRSGLEEGEKVVLDPTKLLKKDSDMKPGKIRSKPGDQSQDQDSGSAEPKKGGKKGGKKKADGTTTPPTGSSPIIGGQGGAPNAQQIEAWLGQMRDLTPEGRRDWLTSNIADEAMRDQTKQFLLSKGLDVPD